MAVCKTCLRPYRTRFGSAQWHQRNDPPGGYCSCELEGLFPTSRQDEQIAIAQIKERTVMSNIQDKYAYTDGTLTLQEDVSDAIGVYARSRPEEGESWESWFGSAFDLARERVAAVFREHAARNLSTHPGQEEMLAEVRRYGVQTQLSDVSDEMAMAGYNAMRDPATNLPAPWIVLGHAFKVFEAMLEAAPKTEPVLVTGTLGNSVDLLRIAADNGLQIFCPDAEPNAVVRWYPWNDGCRVCADAGDCVSEGLPVNNYSMTFLAIRKALASRGISHSTNDTEVVGPTDAAHFKVGAELSLLAIDAAYEIENPGSDLIATRALGNRLSALNERLTIPYGDVEAAVLMSGLFKELGQQVETIDALRQCVKVVAEMLMDTPEEIYANKGKLQPFCIALTKLQKMS